MLIILEGLDKSGKSTIADLLKVQLQNALLIRKTYNKNLYPIDYSAASEYDWQAILDRVVLANPDMTFIADRSFFTQTVYQMCLGTGHHAITDGQMQAFNNYCKTVSEIPHLIIYCRSSRYELDSMVTNINIKHKLDKLFVNTLERSGLKHMIVDMDNNTLAGHLQNIMAAIRIKNNIPIPTKQ